MWQYVGADGDDGINGLNGVDGINGLNGVDGTVDYTEYDTYYCSSRQEILDAITAIGDGIGTIMLQGNFSFEDYVEIDGGGSYLIQGVGSNTIRCGLDKNLFWVTNAKTCTIRDLRINATAITTTLRTIIANK